MTVLGHKCSLKSIQGTLHILHTKAQHKWVVFFPDQIRPWPVRKGEDMKRKLQLSIRCFGKRCFILVPKPWMASQPHPEVYKLHSSQLKRQPEGNTCSG